MFSCSPSLMAVLVCTGEVAGAAKWDNSAPAAVLADFLSVVQVNLILVQVVSSSYFLLQTRQRAG